MIKTTLFGITTSELNKPMIHTEINFKVGKKKYKFNLVHNLDEYGLSIDAAFTNYIARYSILTESGFIKYVKSKDPYNIRCMSKADFDENNATLNQ